LGFLIVFVSITTLWRFPVTPVVSRPHAHFLFLNLKKTNKPLSVYTTTTPLLPQYYEAPPALVDILAYMNLIFTMLFSLECILKLAAFGIKVHSYYLRRSKASTSSIHLHTPCRWLFHYYLLYILTYILFTFVRFSRRKYFDSFASANFY
jgi:hypothetical protein